MNKERTCSFTGHRIIQQETLNSLKEKLPKALKSLIQKGYHTFCSGGALGFDLFAAQIVLSLKKEYPCIKLVMILPCRDQERFWNSKQKELYQKVLEKADKIIYTADVYHRGCMQKRNRHLVDTASILIAFLEHEAGGTKYTVEYAEKNHIPVIFLPEAPAQQLSLFHMIS